MTRDDLYYIVDKTIKQFANQSVDVLENEERDWYFRSMDIFLEKNPEFMGVCFVLNTNWNWEVDRSASDKRLTKEKELEAIAAFDKIYRRYNQDDLELLVTLVSQAFNTQLDLCNEEGVEDIEVEEGDQEFEDEG